MKSYLNTFQDTSIGTFVEADAEILAFSAKYGLLQGYDEEVHESLRCFFYQLRGPKPNVPLAQQLQLVGDDKISMACVEQPGIMRTLAWDTARVAYGSLAMRPPSTDPLETDSNLRVHWTVNAHATQRRWTSLLIVPAGHKVIENAIIGHSDRSYTKEGVYLTYHCLYNMGIVEAATGATENLLSGNSTGTYTPKRQLIPTGWQDALVGKTGYRRATAPSPVGYSFKDAASLNGAGITEEDFYTPHEFLFTLDKLSHLTVSEAGKPLIDFVLPTSFPAGPVDIYFFQHAYHTGLEEVELRPTLLGGQRGPEDDAEPYILAAMPDHDERRWSQIGYTVTSNALPPPPPPPVDPLPPVRQPLTTLFTVAEEDAIVTIIDKLLGP